MHILIVRNNSNSKAVDASLLLAAYLATQDISYTIVDSLELSSERDYMQFGATLTENVYMAVVLGGDGAILRTARQVACANVPILGINFGRLGFLSNSAQDGVVAIVAAALAGDVTTDARTNLCVRVVCEGEFDPWCDEDNESYRDGKDAQAGELPAYENASHRFFALNEVAVTRGTNGHVIDFNLGISGSHIAEMRGDGVVVATATGSTAYALSAGGPLVTPEFNGFVVVPLAPHTLHARTIVTASHDVVEIDLSRNFVGREAALFVDGELLSFAAPVRRIYVSRGENPTTLLRYHHENFYKQVSHIFF